jgi:hypothetical protein
MYQLLTDMGKYFQHRLSAYKCHKEDTISYFEDTFDYLSPLLCRKVFFFFFSIQPPVAVGAVEIADIVYINRTVEGYLCMK